MKRGREVKPTQVKSTHKKKRYGEIRGEGGQRKSCAPPFLLFSFCAFFWGEEEREGV